LFSRADFKTIGSSDSGAVDDELWAWENGRFVGEVTKRTNPKDCWQSVRLHPLPADVLKPGRNVIAVLCNDTFHHGGILGTDAEVADSRAKYGFLRRHAGRVGRPLPLLSPAGPGTGMSAGQVIGGYPARKSAVSIGKRKTPAGHFAFDLPEFRPVGSEGRHAPRGIGGEFRPGGSALDQQRQLAPVLQQRLASLPNRIPLVVKLVR
jgi:hypothetical protein